MNETGSKTGNEIGNEIGNEANIYLCTTEQVLRSIQHHHHLASDYSTCTLPIFPD